MSGTSVIVAGARTPIGRLLGGFKSLSAADLGGVAIKGALEKAGVQPEQVDYLIMGQVILAGAGQNPARAAGIAGGLPWSMPSITINKVCLSGLNAIAMADQLIRAGECEIVVAGGMESMTNAPHFLPKSREGFKFGDVKLVDSMAYDALYDQATQQAMGGLTEQINAEGVKLTREEQDAFAAASHQKAAEAWKNGVFDDEVVPVTIPQRKGDPIVVSADEGVRGDTTAESLGKLRAGVREGRHHHRRLRLADLRRRRRRRRDEQGQGRGARPGVARRDRRARHGRRPRLEPADAAGQRDQEGLRRRRASRPPTSTWSSSTRRSPRSASSRPARSASTRRSSTSTAARSRSATRSACPAPAWCCTSRSSSSAAAAASVRPRCAAAVGRATP